MLYYLSHPNRMDGPLAFIPTSNVPELPARPLHRLLTAYHRFFAVVSRGYGLLRQVNNVSQHDWEILNGQMKAHGELTFQLTFPNGSLTLKSL